MVVLIWIDAVGLMWVLCLGDGLRDEFGLLLCFWVGFCVGLKLGCFMVCCLEVVCCFVLIGVFIIWVYMLVLCMLVGLGFTMVVSRYELVW